MIGPRLKNLWLSQGVELNPGVSEDDLDAFEARYQVSLPADVRDYFRTVNGMAEGCWDDALIRFWMLNEVKPVPEEAPDLSDIKDAESLFVFADYSIWAHAYAIHLSVSEAANPIFLIGGETPIRMFSSFSELISTYLTDPDLMFHCQD